MGAMIAAAEEMGMVERKRHSTDARPMIIERTSRGAAVRSNLKDATHTLVADAIAQLNKEEQETVCAPGRIIRRLAEK